MAGTYKSSLRSLIGLCIIWVYRSGSVEGYRVDPRSVLDGECRRDRHQGWWHWRLGIRERWWISGGKGLVAAVLLSCGCCGYCLVSGCRSVLLCCRLVDAVSITTASLPALPAHCCGARPTTLLLPLPLLPVPPLLPLLPPSFAYYNIYAPSAIPYSWRRVRCAATSHCTCLTMGVRYGVIGIGMRLGIGYRYRVGVWSEHLRHRIALYTHRRMVKKCHTDDRILRQGADNVEES
jgi:hypothetical protein